MGLLIYPFILHPLALSKMLDVPSSLYLRLKVTYQKPDVCKMPYLQKLEVEASAGGRGELKVV